MFGFSYEHTDCNYCRGNCKGNCGECESFTCYGPDQKGICSEYGGYRCYPDDRSCSSFRKSSNRHPSNCYITTSICRILGYEDDCEVLNTLRSFKNNVMSKDEKYKEMINDYDEIGPKIALCIDEQYKEDKKTDIWMNLYNLYLVKSFELIKTGQTEQAINKYTEMVKKLEDYYSIYKDDKVVISRENNKQYIKAENR